MGKNESKDILISVCVPVFNGKAFLAETIKSLQKQTFKDFEIVVSDDFSTDDTLEYTRDLLLSNNFTKFKIVTNVRKGIGENWNNCIINARGKYIKYLFQDDVLEPNCLQEMLAFLENNDKIGLIATKRSFIKNQEIIDSDVEDWINTYSDLQRGIIKKKDYVLIDKSLFKRPDFIDIPRNKIGEPSTVMFRKEVTDNVGFFRTDLEQSLDYEYWYRILKYYDIAILEKNLVKFRLHPQQATNINKNRNIRDYVIYKKIIFFNYFLLINSSLRKELFFTVTWLGKLISKLYTWIYRRKKSV